MTEEDAQEIILALAAFFPRDLESDETRAAWRSRLMGKHKRYAKQAVERCAELYRSVRLADYMTAMAECRDQAVRQQLEREQREAHKRREIDPAHAERQRHAAFIVFGSVLEHTVEPSEEACEKLFRHAMSLDIGELREWRQDFERVISTHPGAGFSRFLSGRRQPSAERSREPGQEG